MDKRECGFQVARRTPGWIGCAVAAALAILPFGAFGAATNYVDAARPDDSGAGTSWATAKKTLQAAVDQAAPGDVVLATNGLYALGGAATPGYALTNRVCVTSAVTVRSVNGWEHTVIQGAEAPAGGCDTGAVRCAYLSGGAALIGFTLTNGYTMKPGHMEYEQSAGAVFMPNLAKASVMQCLVTGNRANGTGRCSAIWMHGANNWVESCIVAGNETFGTQRAAVFCNYGGTVTNCIISGNSYGVYLYYASAPNGLWNSTVSGNRSFGVLMVGGTISACAITHNLGGGIYADHYNATIQNCLIASNSASKGGGVYEKYRVNDATVNLWNCTVVANTATTTSADGGGGVYVESDGRLAIENCLIRDNVHAVSSNIYASSAHATIGYTCSAPLPVGEGNIDAHPQFRSPASGNYRLRGTSPCLNAGTNQAWMAAATDLDGAPRLGRGSLSRVDMGAYEYGTPQGSVIGIR